VPAFFAALYLMRSMLRRGAWSWLSVVAILAYLYAITEMGYRVRRYFHFAGWKSVVATAPVVSGVWIDSFSPATEQALVQDLVARFSPALLIVGAKGAGPLVSQQVAGAYNYRVSTSPAPDGVIEIHSRFKPATDKVTELGSNALPGGVVSLIMPDGGQFEIGVLMLERSVDKESFERNRISSRRLSSLMRSSQQRRLVVGNFNTTPFSMLSSIFNAQSRMYSLIFGSGFVNVLKSLNVNSSAFGRNVFVSSEISPKDLQFIAFTNGREPALFFSVLVGQTMTQPAADATIGE
jgi:hypothetical protein